MIFESASLNSKSIPFTKELPVLNVMFTPLDSFTIPSFKKLFMLNSNGFGIKAGAVN